MQAHWDVETEGKDFYTTAVDPKGHVDEKGG